MSTGEAHRAACAGICNCVTFKNSNPGIGSYYVRLRKKHNNPADITTLRACVFNCPGGTCRVRGCDGLPVELMSFEVQSEDSPDKPESEQGAAGSDSTEDS